jgi:hypothetical protein
MRSQAAKACLVPAPTRREKTPGKWLRGHHLEPEYRESFDNVFLDECPWLWRRTLIAAGAFGAGSKTRWTWPEIADAPTVEVTGGDHAFTIGEVRVVVTKRGMICPRCGRGCYALVFHDGWGCRRCSGCKYRIKYRPSPMVRRRSILRSLARADPLSLKTYVLERKLCRVNRAIVQRARNVGKRLSPDRRRRRAWAASS